MLKQLLEKRAALLARCDEIELKAKTENNRALTEDERTEFRAKLEEAKALNPQIKELEDLATQRAEQIAAEARAAAQPQQQRPNPAGTGAAAAHENAEDKPFTGLGDFLRSVMLHDSTRGVDYDPRLRKYDVRDLKVRAAAGMNEAIGAEGGFLVGVDQGPLMQKQIFETGVLASRVKKIPIGPNSNGIKIPYVDETSRANGSRWGGVRTYWLNEAEAKTSSKPKFGVMELGLNKVAAVVYMTDELLQDATAAESYASQAVTDELGFAVDDAIVRGSGAGIPLGILNSPATISVAKETSQAAATVVYANVAKMRARMLPRSFANAVWLVNVDVLAQLDQMFVAFTNKAGTENVGGAAVYMPPGGISGAPFGTLFGRPVIPIEQAETVGTVGDIMLVDLGMYLMTTKGGVQTASSIHVNFLTDETAFRFVLRTDGQPAIKSAITPYKGANGATLSAFVTLATRA